MHLLIATREDPSLPLAHMHVRGQMTELCAADLRFTSAEAAEFLNRIMGLDLSEKDIGAPAARTEGWITCTLSRRSLRWSFPLVLPLLESKNY
jgi:LuxR family maltose regulon positive regulatory protein